jgi:tetratricopeptide (TPR) repeat protein
VHYVLTGSFGVEGDEISLITQAVDCSAPEFVIMAEARAVGHKDEICSLSDRVVQDLLGQMGLLPDAARVREMSKVPTLNFDARRECDAGFRLLYQVAATSPDSMLELSEKALKHAEAAVQTDPNYLQAYILKASCLWNLDRMADVETCLRAARIKSDPASVDELTRLELDGDYATFVERNFDRAIESYKKILEIDAGHVRALWSLTGLYTGNYGAADAGIDDAEVAAQYAARLVAAHPDSPMAIPFAREQSQKEPLRKD